MIYLFRGTDTGKVRAQAFKWVEAARKKAPEAHYVRLSPEQVTNPALEEVSASSGLFFKKMLVLIDDPFSLAASGEAVLDMLPHLAASPNPIAILAPKMKAVEAKKVESKAEKTFTFESAAKKEGRGFNVPLVNALAAKNQHVLWLEIERALRAGDAPEMLHGLLHWKARDIMKKGSRVWNEQESRKLSLGLIELLSDARSGSLDLSLALERWSLSL
jgi:hypothetical protein